MRSKRCIVTKWLCLTEAGATTCRGWTRVRQMEWLKECVCEGVSWQMNQEECAEIILERGGPPWTNQMHTWIGIQGIDDQTEILSTLSFKIFFFLCIFFFHINFTQRIRGTFLSSHVYGYHLMQCLHTKAVAFQKRKANSAGE